MRMPKKTSNDKATVGSTHEHVRTSSDAPSYRASPGLTRSMEGTPARPSIKGFPAGIWRFHGQKPGLEALESSGKCGRTKGKGRPWQ